MKIEHLVALDDVPDGLSRITLPEGQFLTFVGKTGVAIAKIRPGGSDRVEPGPPPDTDPIEPVPSDDPGFVKFRGLIHKPTPEKPDRGVKFKVPAGVYKRIDFQMDFVHNGWSDDDPPGRHLVVWFVKKGNFDMVLQLSLLGPPKSKWVWRHGFGLKHGEKPRAEGAYPFNDGHHRIKYTYQAGGSATLEVLRENQLIINKTDAVNVDEFVVDPKDNFKIGLGNPEGHDDEPPTFGWEYRDIEVRLQKA